MLKQKTRLVPIFVSTTFSALVLVGSVTVASPPIENASSPKMRANFAAERAAPSPFVETTIADIIQHLQVLNSKKALDAAGSDLLKFATIAREAFGMDKLTVHNAAPNPDPNKRLEGVPFAAITRSITDEIQNWIRTRKSWDETFSKVNLEKITVNESLMKKNLGEKSYSWAWVTYQQGKRSEAKRLLSESFDENYGFIMGMQENWQDRNLIVEPMSLDQALKPMSSEAENQSRTDKLQKLRTHISNMPNMMRAT